MAFHIKRFHFVSSSFLEKCNNFKKFKYKLFELLTLHSYIVAANDTRELVDGSLEKELCPLQCNIYNSIPFVDTIKKLTNQFQFNSDTQEYTFNN